MPEHDEMPPAQQEETGTRELDDAGGDSAFIGTGEIALEALRRILSLGVMEDVSGEQALIDRRLAIQWAQEALASLPSGDGERGKRATDLLFRLLHGGFGWPDWSAELPADFLAKLDDWYDGRLEVVAASPSGETGAVEEALLQVGERLKALGNGPGPDRDEGYQDAWRRGVDDARDVLAEFAATPPDESAPPAGETGDGRELREFTLTCPKGTEHWRIRITEAANADVAQGWDRIHVREIPSEGGA